MVRPLVQGKIAALALHRSFDSLLSLLNHAIPATVSLMNRVTEVCCLLIWYRSHRPANQCGVYAVRCDHFSFTPYKLISCTPF